jgi:hypothetical protein
MTLVSPRVLAASLLATLVATTASAQLDQANMQEFMKAMGAIMGGTTNGAPPAVVDFRELKALLPAELPAMKRTNASGEKNAAMGITVSSAEGRYEGGDGYIEIKLSDNGGMGGFMAFAQAGWSAAEIDRETDTGFERTTTLNGQKAKEEYDNESRHGKIEVLVGGRFMVEVTGGNVSFDQIQTAAKMLDYAKLAALKPAAAQP